MRLERHPNRVVDGELSGLVMFIDRFGNALTNIKHEALKKAFPGAAESGLVVVLGNRRIRGIARSYGDAPIGTLIAIVGSSGRLEVAQVGGHAALRFGFGEGDRVAVRAESGSGRASRSES